MKRSKSFEFQIKYKIISTKLTKNLITNKLILLTHLILFDLVYSILYNMSKMSESLATTRERRTNAGSKMSSLLDREEVVDDFYKTTYGGFEEVFDSLNDLSDN